MIPQIDAAVVKRAQAGDENAFALIVQAHEKQIFNYVLASVRDRELAEDITQDVFLRAWRALPTYGFRSQLTTWLYQVAKNLVLDTVRSRQVRIETVELLPGSEPACSDRSLEQTEAFAVVWEAVEDLPPELRSPLLLRDVWGLSYNEIAAKLEIPLSLVKWRIYKAREAVQLALVESVEDEEAHAA